MTNIPINTWLDRQCTRVTQGSYDADDIKELDGLSIRLYNINYKLFFKFIYKFYKLLKLFINENFIKFIYKILFYLT